MNGYFSTSILATLGLGLSTKPYIWVMRSLTISFLTSGFNFFSEIANIMLGFHFVGMVKSLFDEEKVPSSQSLELVDGIDGIGAPEEVAVNTKHEGFFCFFGGGEFKYKR